MYSTRGDRHKGSLPIWIAFPKRSGLLTALILLTASMMFLPHTDTSVQTKVRQATVPRDEHLDNRARIAIGEGQ